MRIPPLSVPCLIVLALFCGAGQAATRLSLDECRIEPEAGASFAASCGRYRVAEDRTAPKGKELQLRVVVVPALRLTAAPDPLFILSGGPGQAATDFYAITGPAFARIRRDRDIVLVDQRGTGESNQLTCAFPDDADLALTDSKALETRTRTCLGEFRGDPRFYTTSVAVRDLDEVRAALGYERINLYGVSYGTRVAQHYMRRYPGRVRAAILDGVVPPGLGLGPDAPLEAQRALDTLFDRCVADRGCNGTFPDLRGQFATLRSRLATTPATVALTDPLDGSPVTTPFGIQHLSAAVRLLTYSDETASLLPLLIHEAQTAGRPQAMAAQYLMIRRTTDTQIAYGMHFAVVCSEDVPRWASAARDPALDHTYMGRAFVDSIAAICSAWPRGEVDADFGAPLMSATPALLLSGGNDPVTPAAYGQRVLSGFPNGRHLIVEGQGHGQIGSGCIPLIAADFIQRATTKDLAVGCVDDIAPAPFMLSRSAPAP